MINAYDFDGTIYDGDSSVDFYLFCLKKNKKVLLQLPIQIWGTILYIFGIIEKTAFKEKIFSFLKRIDNVDDYIKEFWNKNEKKIKPWYLEQKKSTDVIISASPEFLLNPLKKKLKIDRVIATKTNKKTGIFESKNCHDYEKIKRYEEIYKDKKIKAFYSDSVKADRAMLEYADEAYLVKGDKVSKIDIKNYQENTDNILIKIFLGAFFIVFLYIFLNVIFNNESPIPKCNGWQSVIALILYSVFVYILYKLLSKVKLPKIIKLIALLLFIGIQLAFAYIFVVEPTWDFGAVYNSAIMHINDGLKVYNNDYFYRYSNNLGIEIILIAYYRILSLLHIKSYLKMGILLNIIMIDLSILFLRGVLKQLFEEKRVDLFTILMLIFTPFVTYVPIFYTDTMSIPFAIAGVYFYLKVIENKKLKEIILYSVLSGIFIGIGSFIKFTVVIVFIAIVVFQVVNIKRLKIKKFMIAVLCLGLPIIFFNSLILIYQNTKFDAKRIDKESFPYTHWLMMGTYGKGAYNHSDVEYTASFNSIEKKKKANINVMKKRLSEMYKNHKLINFYTTKITFVWGDGTLFAPEKLTREPKKNLKIKKYIIGEKNNAYLKISQGEWLFCLLSVLLGIIFRKFLSQKQKDVQLICLITMFGTLIFFILWESRSRYIVNMAPLIILSAFIGVEAIIQKINKGLKKYEKKK